MRRILKFLKWFFIIIVGILAIISLILVLTGNSYVFRGITLTYFKGKTTANIDDYQDFDNRIIHKSTNDGGEHNANQTHWQLHPSYNQIPLTPALQKALDTDGTVAFAIIKDGTLLYDNYWQGYAATSHTNSFSMSKSIVTMLYLKAVEDGYITSIDDPISTWLPEYADNPNAQNCTLADLSGMTSGYDWTEDYYFPINPTAKAYYGHDLTEHMLSRDFVHACGSNFDYSSGDTQLLAIALTRALKPHGHTLSSYLESKFWQPLYMQGDAYWSLDGAEHIEKAYCCISASALDFAKFGQLLLNKGEYNGEQLLSQDHIDFMITPNAQAFPKDAPRIYGHSIWTDMDSPIPHYAMLGHLGQRVIVIPEHNLIIVRLGKRKGLENSAQGFHLESDIGFYVSEVVSMIEGIDGVKGIEGVAD